MEFLAPSFPNDDSFFCRFFLNVGAYKDAADRHLHEVDFRAEEQPEAFKACPFHDSRKGYLMNFSALKQIMSEWPDIKAGMGFFSKMHPVDRAAQTDVARAWRITLATMFAPMYLTHRQQAPYAHGTLPTNVSGLFKIMLDVPTTIDLMMLGDARTSSALCGAEAMVAIRDFADTQKILLNTDYACAGSPKLMDDINVAMFAVDGGDQDGHEAWRRIFPDTDHFQSFAYLMTVQYAISQMYQIATALSMEDAFKKAAAKNIDISFTRGENEERLSAYERRRRYMLAAVSAPGAGLKALETYSALAADGKAWGSAVKTPPALKKCFDLSGALLASLQGRDEVEILQDYEEYSQSIEAEIKGLQKTISDFIGAPDLFPATLTFVKEADKAPHRILRDVLRHSPAASRLG